ncbi:EamA/RhaT family transporter [Hydrogenovibrio sp. SC-1]|uniref:DMT family transporter n=1 Tax=Hydrogenovibrio sp. SC-1 TaxID=2065820 RepID=UPI000C7AD1C4|nr:DMT family transporter [Hydrogenovibrio sp. SC-1]PLA73588.1 EamA/RhaT family transporter [Hydrogenovibrio sp. SC-1]
MQNRAVIVLFVASILWGLTWLPLKSLHEQGFHGIALTFFVYLALLVIMLPWCWRQRRYLLSDWRILVGVALLGGGAQLAFNTALIYGEVIRVMVLFYLVPLWGVLGGRIFLKERIDAVRWLGVGLSVIGAFLVVGGMNAFIAPPSWIDAVALLSGFLFAMNNIVFRVSPTVSVYSKLAFMFLGAVLLSSILLLATEQSPWNLEVSNQAWLLLGVYAAVWMMAANLGTQWAVTHMEAGRSSIIVIFELVTAVVSASILLGETLSPYEMVGGTLIVLAAFLEARRQ